MIWKDEREGDQGRDGCKRVVVGFMQSAFHHRSEIKRNAKGLVTEELFFRE